MRVRPGRADAAARGYQAEAWTAKLFRALGYKVHTGVVAGGLEIDLVVEKDDLRSPVEVKAPGSDRLFGVTEVVQQAARLRNLVERGPLVAPIVVIVGRLTRSGREMATGLSGFRFWDVDDLRRLSHPFPALHAELEALAEGQVAPAPPPAGVTEEASRLIARLEAHVVDNTLTPTAYEELCQEVFTFLFDPDLYGFQRQAQTTDGGNRYDFICRIKPGNPFWDSLRHDFRTKAILFECKNYNDPIGPDQVYSTERYLFAGGLRTVAFLIARMGANDAALRAAQGAMRESAKLLLLFSNADLIAMVRLKDDPSGPASFIEEKIWNFVISLPR